MGRLIDTSNIRVKPQYMQDVMGIAMIRCEDLSRILAEVPTEEAYTKDEVIAMLADIKLKIKDVYVSDNGERFIRMTCRDYVQEKINDLEGR